MKNLFLAILFTAGAFVVSSFVVGTVYNLVTIEEETPCDQEELDRLSEEIGAYEITCEELGDL